jgi:hypothetical protein
VADAMIEALNFIGKIETPARYNGIHYSPDRDPSKKQSQGQPSKTGETSFGCTDRFF